MDAKKVEALEDCVKGIRQEIEFSGERIKELETELVKEKERSNKMQQILTKINAATAPFVEIIKTVQELKTEVKK